LAVGKGGPSREDAFKKTECTAAAEKGGAARREVENRRAVKCISLSFIAASWEGINGEGVLQELLKKGAN